MGTEVPLPLMACAVLILRHNDKAGIVKSHQFFSDSWGVVVSAVSLIVTLQEQQHHTTFYTGHENS